MESHPFDVSMLAMWLHTNVAMKLIVVNRGPSRWCFQPCFYFHPWGKILVLTHMCLKQRVEITNYSFI